MIKKHNLYPLVLPSSEEGRDSAKIVDGVTAELNAVSKNFTTPKSVFSMLRKAKTKHQRLE